MAEGRMRIGRPCPDQRGMARVCRRVASGAIGLRPRCVSLTHFGPCPWPRLFTDPAFGLRPWGYSVWTSTRLLSSGRRVSRRTPIHPHSRCASTAMREDSSSYSGPRAIPASMGEHQRSRPVSRTRDDRASLHRRPGADYFLGRMQWPRYGRGQGVRHPPRTWACSGLGC
jgi:hypothetical protein